MPYRLEQLSWLSGTRIKKPLINDSKPSFSFKDKTELLQLISVMTYAQEVVDYATVNTTLTPEIRQKLTAINTSAAYLSGSRSEAARSIGLFLIALSAGILLTCMIGAVISASGGPDILAKVAEWASFGLQDIITANTSLTTQVASDLAGATVFGVGATVSQLIGAGLFSRNTRSKGVALAAETFVKDITEQLLPTQ